MSVATSRGQGLRVAGLLAFAGLAVSFAAVRGFRLTLGNDFALLTALAWPRAVMLVAAGLALGGGGALLNAAGGRSDRELYLFAISFGATLVGGRFAQAHSMIAGFAGAAGALAAGAIAWVLLRRNRLAWLALAASIPLVFYGLLWAAGWGRGNLTQHRSSLYWLLGDASDAGWTGALLVLTASIVTLGLAVQRVRGLAVLPVTGHDPAALDPRDRSALLHIALVLCGLSIGAVGPVAFVGFFAPVLACRLSGVKAPAATLALSALAGAVSLLLLDGVPRALSGGLSYPLNMQTWLVFGVPFVVAARQALPLGGRASRWLERGTLALLGLFLLFVFGVAAYLTPIIKNQ